MVAKFSLEKVDIASEIRITKKIQQKRKSGNVAKIIDYDIFILEDFDQ